MERKATSLPMGRSATRHSYLLLKACFFLAVTMMVPPALTATIASNWASEPIPRGISGFRDPYRRRRAAVALYTQSKPKEPRLLTIRAVALTGWLRSERGLVGERRGHGELDAADADARQGCDLQRLKPDGGAGWPGKAGVRQADAVERAEQNVGHRGKPQPESLGAHGGGAGAVCQHIQLNFLDAVWRTIATCIAK
jgi:hypothetical protein